MTVHFVGSGPGAADLLTMRAVAMLRAAEVVLYAGTYLDEEVLSQCADDAELIDTQHLDLDGITAHLVDASLYSALTEQARRLDAAGVPWDVTPGVPAYAAAAAALGTELTVPELAQTIVLTRTQARSTAMPATESLGKVAGIRASLVLHLAITRTRVLADELSVEYGADCPCAVVAFAYLVEEAGLKHTAVILVGRALGIREQPGVACSHLYDPARDRTT